MVVMCSDLIRYMFMYMILIRIYSYYVVMCWCVCYYWVIRFSVVSSVFS